VRQQFLCFVCNVPVVCGCTVAVERRQRRWGTTHVSEPFICLNLNRSSTIQKKTKKTKKTKTKNPAFFWTQSFITVFTTAYNLMFVAPCIIVQFVKKIQQDATVYQNFYYSIFIWSSTCFGRHTARHQEPKTALAASGFPYVKVCRTCSWWTLSGTVPDNVHQLHVQQLSTYEKPEAASAVLGSWWQAVCRPKHVELHINME